jgi:hypothetical protein
VTPVRVADGGEAPASDPIPIHPRILDGVAYGFLTC